MAYAITPSLGVDLSYVGDKPYYDDNSSTPTPALGSVVRGSDGGEYFFVKASAEVASTATTGTECDYTFATHTVATKAGAGGYWTPPGVKVPKDEYCWVRKGAWNAAPA